VRAPSQASLLPHLGVCTHWTLLFKTDVIVSMSSASGLLLPAGSVRVSQARG